MAINAILIGKSSNNALGDDFIPTSIIFEDNQVIETNNEDIRLTTFNNDNTVVTFSQIGGQEQIIKTIFNEDGSITQEID